MSLQPTGRYRGRWVTLARWAWIALAFLMLLLLGIGVVTRYNELLTVTPDAAIAFGQLRPQDLVELHRLGFALEQYAAYFTLAETLTCLVFVLVAVIIFIRRSDEWIALFVATMLLLLPSVLPLVSAVQRAGLVTLTLLQTLQVAYYVCVGTFLFAFPDGRVVPRWARFIILALIGYALITLPFPSLLAPTSFGAGVSPDAYLPLGFAVFIYTVGVGGQLYRYFRISTLAQRQQTKWVVFGLAVFCILATLGIALLFQPPNQNGAVDLTARLVAPTLVLLAILTIPLSIGFSILRYRLYDIDVIIRRTVTYALVTGLLAALFFGSVIVLQLVFANSFPDLASSEIVTVLSTLAIAALFVPLRNRVQNEIDKRFNRKKYDAQKIMEKFSRTVRDETDIDRLTNELVNVVQETMQPKSVSLWLKKEKRGKS